MGESLTLAVRNAADAIAPASETAEAWLARQGADPETVYLVLLAIEELVTNCIKYAYDDAAEHIVAIELATDGRVVRMTVSDDGRPFDPLTAPAPDIEADAADRKIGGLGLFLLRKLADNVTYERRDRINRLTLTRRMA